jgi:D-alanyl-D-alanine carboxypeptidase/D-alanyl-D-alanine-endopeptidase (penicillin-binding protein 4)
MSSRFLSLFLAFSSLVWGQQISSKRIARELKKIPAFQQAHVAISVSALKNKKVVASYQGGHYMTPASNVKLLTFLAAKEQFNKLPTVSYYKENDSLIHFKATGYPLLLHPFYPETTLNSFFNQAARFIYHPALITPNPLGEGWAWDDYPYYYAAERSAFPIYGNAVQAILKDNTLELTPSFFEIMAAKDSVGSKFKRLQSANAFSYNLSEWQKKDTLTRPFITSDSLFVKLLSKSLGNEVVLANEIREEFPWEEHYSKDDAPLYRALLQDSDNGIAEALLLMIGQEKFNEMDSQKAIDSILFRWKPWLLDPVAWVDGSGVSRYNMITPRTLVGVLQKIEEKFGWKTIQSYFPQGASSGTLKKYTNNSVYAKTGTLRHNYNLSGYLVHPKGTTYAFSIMVNHHTAKTEEVRAGIGTLLKWLERKLK